MRLARSYIFIHFWAVFISLATSPAWAKRGSEALYIESFDLAAGGTCLTRASQEGILFGNPALLPLGGAWVRWFGIQTSTVADKETAGSGSSLQTSDTATLLNEAFSRSLHLGQTFTMSFMHKNLGLSIFDRLELDLEGSRYDAAGLPALNLGIEAYGGGVFTMATQPVNWFSLGVTSKYILVGEPEISIPLGDPAAAQATFADQTALKQQLNYGLGAGADLGMLFFLQGRTVDKSLAIKIDDVGGTNLSEGAPGLPQSTHIGLGLAFHGSKEVLHLSLEHRDVFGQYRDEPKFQKIYLGARMMFRKQVGVAVGLYQGIPTFGIRSELSFWKIGLTYYGRELGDFPGDRQRNLISTYTSIGF